MTARKLRVTRAARGDLENIRRRTIDSWGRERWLRYYGGLEATFERIRAEPRSGRERRALAPGLRSMLCGSHVVFFYETRRRARRPARAVSEAERRGAELGRPDGRGAVRGVRAGCRRRGRARVAGCVRDHGLRRVNRRSTPTGGFVNSDLGRSSDTISGECLGHARRRLRPRIAERAPVARRAIRSPGAPARRARGVGHRRRLPIGARLPGGRESRLPRGSRRAPICRRTNR